MNIESTASGDVVSDAEEFLITHGPLSEAMWHMAWPLLLNMLAVSIGMFAEMWVAGILGPSAQAAMGISGQVWGLMMILILAFETGTIALVSRYFGARDLKLATEAARQALIFSAIVGVATACMGLLPAHALLHLLGKTPEIERLGWGYLQFSSIASIPCAMLWVSQAILRGIGDARTAMFSAAITYTFVVVLDFVLCLYPFHMSTQGLGLAWLISESAGFLWNVTRLSRSPVSGCLKFMESIKTGLSANWLKRFLNIGLPGCMQEVALIGGSLGLFYVLSKSATPTIAQAAMAVGVRIEIVLVSLPMFALNLAIATIVGQNLGAKQPARAEHAGWYMTLAGIILSSIVAAVFWFCAPQLAQLMSSDASVISVAVSFFRWIAISEPFLGAWFILSGAMQGAGYTRLPMVVTVVCYDVLRLSAAWFLTVVNNAGPNGTWLAIASTNVIAALLMALSFKWGKWKHHEV